MRISDGSSDVCSSDLKTCGNRPLHRFRRTHIGQAGRDGARAEAMFCDRYQTCVDNGRLRGRWPFSEDQEKDEFGESNLADQILTKVLLPQLGRESCRERVCQYV